VRNLGAGLVVAVTLTLPVLPHTPPKTSPFCAAVATFNATRPTSKAQALAGLTRLAQASPARVKAAITVIMKAAKRGDVSGVLTQASGASPGPTGPLNAAGTTIIAATQTCHPPLNLLAAVPTGISDRKVPPRAWVMTICTSLTTWGQNLNAAGASLVTPASGVTTTVPEERNVFAHFVGTAILQTQQLITQLNNAGTPNTKHGPAFAASVHDAVTQAQQAFEQAQPAVQALPDDPQAFQTQTKTLVQNLNDAGTRVVAGFHDAENTIKDPALSQAFFDESTCKGIA
jgi:hypothetical protein